jgi:hypothetical protein
MSNLNKTSIKTKTIATIAIFSALYAAIRPIPLGPIIGLSASFSVSDALAPLYGIILGPYVGGLSVLTGTFIGMALGKAPVFLGLDFLPALVNAVALGFLMRKKWLPVVVLYAGLLVAFVLYPMTSVFINVPIGNATIALPFVWLHIVAFVVLLSPLTPKAVQWIQTLKPSRLTAGIAILAFIGTMMQHLTGNLVFEVVLGEPIGGITLEGFRGIWAVAFFAYPVERTVLVIISVVIGVPLVRVLKKSLFAEKPAPANPEIPSKTKKTSKNAQVGLSKSELS